MASLLLAAIFVFFSAGTSIAKVSFKNVQCNSWNYKWAECQVGITGNPDVVAMSVVKKDSRSSCDFGKSYGFTGSKIWVDKGCRALFNVQACSNTKGVKCSSERYAFKSCDVAGVRDVEYVILKSQISKSACNWSDSFGPAAGTMWVNKGCRGLFLACY